MGAWGVGAFENDDAADWAYELEGSSGDQALRTAFDAVTATGGGYLDLDVGARAIAAAEVTAMALGRPGATLTDAVTAWVAANRDAVSPEVVALAVHAVERVAGDSEAQELWDESPDADAWHASVDDLLRRLQAP